MFTAKVTLLFLIMKNSILNLGKALNKAEQQTINGGTRNAFEEELCSCISPENTDLLSTHCYRICFLS